MIRLTTATPDSARSDLLRLFADIQTDELGGTWSANIEYRLWERADVRRLAETAGCVWVWNETAGRMVAVPLDEWLVLVARRKEVTS